ncbi:MAG: hypothetical protein ACOYKJ_06980 [Candidatus Howiella sp.]|jgi:hypothetical protein
MLTVDKLGAALGLEILCPGDPEREVKGGYCGDLLSWVMGRAAADDAWITVMGNVNAIAVAVLADVSCIILADSSALDADARARAEQQGVAVLRSAQNQYDLCCALGRLIG